MLSLNSGAICEQPKPAGYSKNSNRQNRIDGLEQLYSADRLLFTFPKREKNCFGEAQRLPLFHVSAFKGGENEQEKEVPFHHFRVVQEFRVPDCLCDIENLTSICCCAEDFIACCISCLIPPARKPFLYDVIDDSDNSIIRVDKPFKCLWPFQGPLGGFGCSCCKTCRDEVSVESPSGHYVGSVEQFSCCQEHPYLSIRDVEKQEVILIGHKAKGPWYCLDSCRRLDFCGCLFCLCGQYRLGFATRITGCCLNADEVAEMHLYDVTYAEDNEIIASIGKIIRRSKQSCVKPNFQFEINCT